MRWPRLLYFFLAAVSAVLIVGLLYLLTGDQGRFKPQIEDLLGELLQREFAIDGPLSVRIGKSIEIQAAQLRLAATDWSEEPQLVTIGRVEARIDTWSLLFGPILIEFLAIDGVRLNLESQGEGAGNWVLFAAGDGAEEEDEDESDARFVLPVLPENARVTDLILNYRKPVKPESLRVTVSDAKLVIESPAGASLNLNGSINHEALTLSLQAGKLEELIPLRQVELNLSGALGEVSFSGQAKFLDLLHPHHPIIDLELDGPNVEYLTDLLKLERFATGPLQLDFEAGTDDSRMHFSIAGELGEFSLIGSGHFDDLQNLQNTDARLSVSGPDIAATAALLGVSGFPLEPFNIQAVVARSGPSVTVKQSSITIGNAQFRLAADIADYSKPSGAEVSLRIAGPDLGRFSKLLGLPGQLEGPFKLDADLVPQAGSGGKLKLHGSANALELRVAANILEQEDFLDSTVQVELEVPNFQVLAAALGQNSAPGEVLNLHLEAARISGGAKLHSARATLGSNEFVLEGRVGDFPLKQGTDLSFDFSGPDIKRLLLDFGVDADQLPASPYTITGRVEKVPEHYVLHELVAALGEELKYALRASGTLSEDPQLLGSHLDIQASGESLGALADSFEMKNLPYLPFKTEASIDLGSSGYRIDNAQIELGDDRIDIDGLIGLQPLQGGTNLHVSASLRDLKSSLEGFGFEVAPLPSGKLEATGDIQSKDGYYDIPGFEINFAGAEATIRGKLGSIPSFDRMDLSLVVSGDNFARLLPPHERLSAMDKSFELQTQLDVSAGKARLSGLQFRIDKSELTASGDFSVESPLQAGQIRLTAVSPDLFDLFPKLHDLVMPDEAPLVAKVQAHWTKELWVIDDLDISMAEGHIEAAGRIDHPPNFDRTDLKFRGEFASLRNFSAVIGRELPDDPVRLKLHLLGEAKEIALRDFTGYFGESDITGDFSYRAGDIPRIDASLVSRRINLEPYLPPIEEVKASPTAATKSPIDKKARLIPDIEIPMGELSKLDASIDVKVAQLNLREGDISELEMAVTLRDGALTVDNITFIGAHNGRAHALGGLKPSAAGASAFARISGHNVALGLPAMNPADLAALPTFDVDIALSGKGRTLRDLAGGLNGYARIVGGRGKLKSNAMKAFTNDFFYELISTLNPFVAQDSYTNLHCVALLATVEDGRLKGKPLLVMESDQLNIFANARIDMKSEKVDVNFNTVPQKGLGISLSNLVNPYVKMYGTLANPALTLDPESTLIEGGAAVATGGISILVKGFYDRYLTAQHPCDDAVADGDAHLRFLEKKYGKPGVQAKLRDH